MPTYAYACTSCDHRFEAVQSFSDDSLTTCPQCEGRLRKVFSAVGVVFKGSGFYRTDSRSNGSSATLPAGGAKEAGSTATADQDRVLEQLDDLDDGIRRQEHRRGLCRLRHGLLPYLQHLGRWSAPGRPGPDHRSFAGRRRRPQGAGLPAPRSTAPVAGAAVRRAAASLACMSTPSGTSVSSTSRADIGVIGGSGLLRVPRRRRTRAGDHPVRRPERRHRGRRRRGPPGRLRRPSRARPPLPAAPGQLPGQPLGAAGRRRPPGAGSLRRRLAGPRPRARHRRRPRPGRRPHVGPRPHGLRRARARSCTPGSPTPTARAAGPPSCGAAEAAGTPTVAAGTLVVINGPRFSSRAESRWHQAAGLDRRRHDRHAGGLARPRAGHVLHHDRARHRPRRRRRGRRGGHPRRGAAGLRRQRHQPEADPACARSPRCLRPRTTTARPARAGAPSTACRSRWCCRREPFGRRPSAHDAGSRPCGCRPSGCCPPGWRGSGRRAVWRRARLRRGLAAVLVGARRLAGRRRLPARSRAGGGAGAGLGRATCRPATAWAPSDLRVERWPEQIRPATALQEPGRGHRRDAGVGSRRRRGGDHLPAARHRTAVRAAGGHGRHARAADRPRRGGARAAPATTST